MFFALGCVTLVGKMLHPHQRNMEAHQISCSFVCSLRESISMILEHEWGKKTPNPNIHMYFKLVSFYLFLHS